MTFSHIMGNSEDGCSHKRREKKTTANNPSSPEKLKRYARYVQLFYVIILFFFKICFWNFSFSWWERVYLKFEKHFLVSIFMTKLCSICVAILSVSSHWDIEFRCVHIFYQKKLNYCPCTMFLHEKKKYHVALFLQSWSCANQMVVFTFLKTRFGGCLDRTGKKKMVTSLGNIYQCMKIRIRSTLSFTYLFFNYSGIYQHLSRFLNKLLHPFWYLQNTLLVVWYLIWKI